MFSTKDILEIIKSAKESGLSKLKLSKNSESELQIELEFQPKTELNNSDSPKFESNVTLDSQSRDYMHSIADEVLEEESYQLTADKIAEWELENYAEIDRQIRLGNIVENTDGSFTVKESNYA